MNVLGDERLGDECRTIFEDTIKKNFPFSRRPYIVAGRRTPMSSGLKGHAEDRTLHLEINIDDDGGDDVDDVDEG